MKIIQILVAMTMFLGVNAYAENKLVETYKVTTSVENAGKVIGSWVNLVPVSTNGKGQIPQIVNVVEPKAMDNGYQKYGIGFNIKMNLAQNKKVNQLAVVAAFSSQQELQLYNEKMDASETTLAAGRLVATPLKSADVTRAEHINTVSFTNIYDVTVPRGIEVPMGRFVLVDRGNQSLVTLKIKVEKN
jgi:hypothetical protein